MKRFKAFRNSCTGEYYQRDSLYENWGTSSAPSLFSGLVNTESFIKDIAPIAKEGHAELVDVVLMDADEHGKIKPNFLKEHPLELLFFGKDIQIVRDVLKKCAESYVLTIKETHREDKSCVFDIVCHKTNFANAHYHIGASIAKELRNRKTE